MKIGRLLMSSLLVPMLSVLLLLALACGGAAAPTVPPTETKPTSPPTPVDTPTTAPVDGPGEEDGEAIFTGLGLCATCHTIEEVATGLVGPDLTHIGTDAGTRKPGVSAEDYIRESIREPEDFVAEGVERATAGVMTSAITANLTDGQLDALVEFLLKQR